MMGFASHFLFVQSKLVIAFLGRFITPNDQKGTDLRKKTLHNVWYLTF